ncbi:glutaredoxin family protein [Actimicrobium sp. CCC2.4]|uniref:glutaredoxin family protein n=1 Tax=Actimicrobium sp. CCC2.4 TaxID=3048606 RepID=UPI002AC8CC42|nr:glutaredoxin family protein [Actimicrobium sp. CCC2.4]MEB0135206.1 glutaredoxin family protein [Actimicrobium sp. CCC2.4]WPX31002.1 glutaredoxin family protein [Actimicrobium sp. CCC2.4]
MIKKTSSLTILTVSLMSGAAMQPAGAQDYGNMLKGLMQGRSGDVLFDTIRSITEVSSGQIASGTQVPQDAQGKVILYRTSWCGYCKKAASYMQQKNIPFVERDIEANKSYQAEMKQLGGKGGVPFIVFGSKTLNGFSESAIDQNYAAFKSTQGGSGSASPAPDAGMGGYRSVPAESRLQSGDALVGKIGGIDVYRQSSKGSPKLLTLGRGEEVIYMGDEHDGLYRVTTSRGEGWVDKLLVKKSG